MPTVEIDGRSIEVENGATVIEAADELGIEIPHYCWHPGLSISGNCRMCLVDIEKSPKLQIACNTRVNDGMVVHTDSERTKTAQKAVLEFLLINHPIDCPVCDQAGECKLQEYYMDYDRQRSRIELPDKVRKKKAVPVGPLVMLDQERCILCARCTRFLDEVTQTHELAIHQRGDHAEIRLAPGKTVDNPYAGNIVDICPVGALTSRDFRFRARVWYLQKTDSVCGACANGCNVENAVDPEWGGLGRAPKFPNVPSLRLLLEFAREGVATARDGLRLTLEKMWRGGIYDHLRGGFARYSTDREWLIPHFEKMLYDNALLLELYAEACVLFPRDTYMRRVVEQTADYLVADMRSEHGGFFSATDADSEGVEGKYFGWTEAQLEEVLGEALGRTFARAYGVTAEGNFEHGLSVLHLAQVLPPALELELAPARAKLLEVRYGRVPPLRDDKLLTAWNALAISGFCKAASAALMYSTVMRRI
jgi:ferredoxin